MNDKISQWRPLSFKSLRRREKNLEKQKRYGKSQYLALFFISSSTVAVVTSLSFTSCKRLMSSSFSCSLAKALCCKRQYNLESYCLCSVSFVNLPQWGWRYGRKSSLRTGYRRRMSHWARNSSPRDSRRQLMWACGVYEGPGTKRNFNWWGESVSSPWSNFPWGEGGWVISTTRHAHPLSDAFHGATLIRSEGTLYFRQRFLNVVHPNLITRTKLDVWSKGLIMINLLIITTNKTALVFTGKL